MNMVICTDDGASEDYQASMKNMSPCLKSSRSNYKLEFENDTRIRRLTPVECCRLQSYPDDWNDCCSDSQRYKQMGNSITVNVAEEIFRRLYGI